MPPRAILSPYMAPSPSVPHVRSPRLSPPLAAVGAGAGFSLFIALTVCFCRIGRKRLPEEKSSPSPPLPPHEFSYSSLRRATASFSPENHLGQGGFGSVFRGSIAPPTSSVPRDVAVKVMDSGSLQGEGEFKNELFFAAKLDTPLVVSVLGFSHDRKQRRMLLVYELMENGNLHDALLRRRCPELMEWNRRFSVAIDIAKGIEYLHGLDPPVIHGDIKPSNILLDQFFSAKISDFGLARQKPDQVEITVLPENDISIGGGAVEYGSAVEELESVITNTTGFEEFNFGYVDQSPVSIPTVSPESTTTAVTVSPEMTEKVKALDGDRSGGKTLKRNGKETKSGRSKDGVERGKVKDYVMEWIGSEVKRERQSSGWIGETTTPSSSKKKLDKKKSNKRLEWWMWLDEDTEAKHIKKQRVMREWWNDKEVTTKKKKKTLESECNSDNLKGSVDSHRERKKKKRRGNSNNSRGSSIEWWLDGQSVNSHDSMSCGIASTTPSMRGTLCYVAPEYGCNIDNVSEKGDVYSYGVVLLVLVSGRRPLEMTGPVSEIQRANLMSWARKLAKRGKLLELIDKKVASLDQKQALLVMNVALQCLQKLPISRPSMKDVVGMLTGDISLRELPSEFSPSPPVPFPSRRHEKQRL